MHGFQPVMTQSRFAAPAQRQGAGTHPWLDLGLTSRQARQTTELVLLESQWLSTDLIDLLAEQQRDWISLLNRDWSVDVYLLSLPSVQQQETRLKTAHYTTQELIEIFYQAMDCTTVYTCCLQTVGLGRVRFAVCFEQEIGQSTAFMTNRLDWSSQKILSQWVQR